MKENKFSTVQLFKFAQNSYLERTSRPIYAIVFLLPFIVFYELGTLLINTDVLNQSQVRVVAFVWLQKFLVEYLGFGSRFAWAAPALVVIVILLALQFASRRNFKFRFTDIAVMGIESALLAVPLIVLMMFIGSSFGQTDKENLPDTVARYQIQNAQSQSPVVDFLFVTDEGSDGTKTHRLLADIVTGVGAGIYEELIFRLILICVLMMLFQDLLRFSRKQSILFSVFLSAVLFSAHHHIDFLNGQVNHADPFDWAKFCFRSIAGVYFAFLFAFRGFGITAGVHAFYDIMAVSINVVFFGH